MDDAERDALREVTRGYLDAETDHATAAAILAGARAAAAPGPGGDREGDRTSWRALAGLGLQGASVAEDLGGAGLGLAAALLVHEELGRALYGGPFLGTVGQVLPGLQALGDVPAARSLITRIAEGSLTAAAAVPLDAPPGLPAVLDAGGGRSPVSPVTAEPTGDGWRLDGGLPCVIDAEVADGLLVAAALPDGGLGLCWADAAAPGVTIQPLPTVDLTRRMARVTFAGAPAAHLAGGAAAGAGLAAAGLAAAGQGLMLALAAECVGLAGRALEMTVGYVATRRQFGRPVGSFQAVKHRCAELLVRLEAARSALFLAASGLDEAAGGEAKPVLPVAGGLAAARLSAARICTGEAAFAITNEAIHLHGGIGFTWDYPLHLYYRRAKSNQQLLDASGGQRIELATRVAALYAEQEQAS